MMDETTVPNNTTVRNRAWNYTASNGISQPEESDGTPPAERWHRLATIGHSLKGIDPEITSNAVYSSMLYSAIAANPSSIHGDDVEYRRTVKKTRELAELRLIENKAGP